MSSTSKQSFHSDRCVNLFVDDVKSHVGKDLRRISSDLLEIYPAISSDSKICSNCRKKAYKLKRSISAVNNSSEFTTDNYNFANKRSREDEISCDDTNNFSREQSSESSRTEELESMLSSLKEKFSSLSPNDPDRIRILTIAPATWSIRKLALEFGTTYHMAKKAKDLRSSKGILPNVTAKAGRTLPDETVQKVKEFYLSDNNSRIMSGKKDTVSLKEDGVKVVHQKRLVLFNLRELHTEYSKLNEENSVGFSKFCELRPKNCILAGAHGTHSVCVCVIHQNCILMLNAINLANLTKSLEQPMKDFKDCLKSIMCEDPTPACYLNQCQVCPGTENLFQLLSNLLYENHSSHVLFSVWHSTDRATLKTEYLPVEEFIHELCERLILLKPHHFIAREQASYLESVKNNLKVGEILVQCDFSENYAFVVQDAAQAFHYNNDQCTVHPIVYYYRLNDKIKYQSILILSDCLSHDTAAVYISQKILIKALKEKLSPQKIIYFSDGAKQHYKNRFNMANLLHHEDDFDLPAEWNYHATAHGKGACDGVGAAMKREAVRASLQAPATQAILSPQALFNWCKSNLKSVDVYFYTKQEHEEVKQLLENRFSLSKPIPNIQKSHSFIPIPEKRLLIKTYSTCPESTVFPKQNKRS